MEDKKMKGRPKGAPTTRWCIRFRNDLLEYAKAHGNASQFIMQCVEEHMAREKQ